MNIRHGLLVLVLALPVLTAAAGAPSVGVSRGTLGDGERQRSYRLFIPQGLDAATAAPLVIALHGGLATGEIFARQTGFDVVAQARGFIVAYPDGLGRVWNAGRCCGNSQSEDVAYIRALVAALKTRLRIDAGRVYGMGFSNGAMLAHRIACEAPELFAAIAPVAGGLMVDVCRSRTAVSALMIQGRLDTRIPWDGGRFDGSYRPSMQEMVTRLAGRGACSSEVKPLLDQPTAQCWERRSCGSGIQLQWCGLPGVGHQWAGGVTYFPLVLGPNTAAFDTSARIGAFFQALRPMTHSHHAREGTSKEPK